jgi:hypothetical protein
MKHSLLYFVALILCSPLPALAGKEAHGEDSFEFSDGVVEVFDKLECTEPFDPMELAEFRRIKTQLDLLSQKLPLAGAYLTNIYRGAGPLWCWVDTPLREIDDEGTSPVEISLNWKKKQLGANTGIFALLHRPTYQRLPEAKNAAEIPSKTLALNHEAMWSALGDACVQTLKGDSARMMSNLILHPGIASKEAKGLASLFDKVLMQSPACEQSPFKMALSQDLANLDVTVAKLTADKLAYLTNHASRQLEAVPVHGNYESSLDEAMRSAFRACNKEVEKLGSKASVFLRSQEIEATPLEKWPTVEKEDVFFMGKGARRFQKNEYCPTKLSVRYEPVYSILKCANPEAEDCKAQDSGSYRCVSKIVQGQQSGSPFVIEEQRNVFVRTLREWVITPY